MTVLGLIENPKQNFVWVGVLLAGVPVYLIWRRATAVRAVGGEGPGSG
jgi:hypothetical protein